MYYIRSLYQSQVRSYYQLNAQNEQEDLPSGSVEFRALQYPSDPCLDPFAIALGVSLPHR